MRIAGEPSDPIKVLHLMLLSFSWGMQLWVSLIAGPALVRQVPRHTFGLVQSKLLRVYFYCLLVGNSGGLVIHALHHPGELLELQAVVYVVALVTAAINAWWLGPATTELMFLLRGVEEEHGLGRQVGLGSQKEAYAKLREQDPKYREWKRRFGRNHGLSSLANLVGFACTTTSLVYTALNLSTI
ncbi:unnamed protein product [Merluccius merluccius]